MDIDLIILDDEEEVDFSLYELDEFSEEVGKLTCVKKLTVNALCPDEIVEKLKKIVLVLVNLYTFSCKTRIKTVWRI